MRTVASMLIWAVLLSVGLAGQAVAQPTSQPGGSPLDLLDRTPLLIRELRSPEPARRLRAAEALGRTGEAQAIDPLIKLLPIRFVSTGLLRLGEESATAAASQPDPLAQHAARLESRSFAASLVSHPQARNWRWVRRQEGATVEQMAGRLVQALSADVRGEQIEVRFADPEPGVASEMVNLVMGIYQRDTETRFAQRQQREQAERQVESARAAAESARQSLDQFHAQNNLAEAARLYEQARKTAAPLIAQYERGEAAVVSQEGRAARAERAVLEAQNDVDRTLRSLERAQDRLSRALRRVPRDENEVAQARQQVDNWNSQYSRDMRDLREASSVRDRVARDLIRMRDALRDLETQIKRILGDLESRYQDLKTRADLLAKAAQQADRKLADLEGKLAELPAMSELADATSTVRVAVRAGQADRQAQPTAVRLAAVSALVPLKAEPAIDVLIELLGDSDPAIVKAARDALGKLTGRSFPDAAGWQKWRKASQAAPGAAIDGNGER